ncbi:MAG: hypothetical protein V7K15_24300 [Nostoc sp.]
MNKYWANRIRYYTNSRLPPWTNTKSNVFNLRRQVKSRVAKPVRWAALPT